MKDSLSMPVYLFAFGMWHNIVISMFYCSEVNVLLYLVFIIICCLHCIMSVLKPQNVS